MKRCTKCGNEYPATTEYFHRDTQKKDGLRFNCKRCCRVYDQAYYQIHSAAIKLRTKAWEKENLDKVREYKRRWNIKAYESDPEKYREKSRQWAKTHRDKVNLANWRWRVNNPQKQRARLRRYRKKHREAIRANKRAYRLQRKEVPITAKYIATKLNGFRTIRSEAERHQVMKKRAGDA